MNISEPGKFRRSSTIYFGAIFYNYVKVNKLESVKFLTSNEKYFFLFYDYFAAEFRETKIMNLNGRFRESLCKFILANSISVTDPLILTNFRLYKRKQDDRK